MPFIKPSIFQKAAKAGGTQAAGAFGLEKILGRWLHASPEASMFTSVLPKAREFAEAFYRRDFAQEKNFVGGASKQGVEIDYEIGKDVLLGSAREKTNLIYQEYRQRIAKQGGIDIPSKSAIERFAKEVEDHGGHVGRLRNRSYLTEEIMLEEVSRAIRRMAVGVDNPHPIPEVNRIAKIYKDEMFDPLLKRQVDNGLLSEAIAKDENFVKSYVSQIWDIEATRRNPQKFLDVVTRAFDKFKASNIRRAEKRLTKAKQKAAKTKTEKGKARAAKAIKTLTQKLENRKTYSARKAAEDFIFDIQNRGNFGMSSSDLFGELSRFQKSRKLHIPKDMLEEFEPFLENNINRIGFLYTRSVLPRILLKEKFGDISLTNLIKSVKQEAYNLATEPGLTATQSWNIQREGDRMANYIAAARDQFLGIYKLPEDPYGAINRVSEGFLKLNLLRGLGGILPASIPDLARQVARFGLVRTARNLSSIMSDRATWELAKNDLKRSVGIYEMMLQDRFFLQAETSRGVQFRSRPEKMLEKMSSGFGKITLISPWNQAQKQFAAFNAASMLLEEARAFRTTGKINERVMRRFLEGGIDKEALAAIDQQFTAKGVLHNGVYIPQTADWKDRNLASLFNGFVKREVEIAITTPGFGSKPLMLSHGLGRHAGQFRAFSFTATNGILLSGLQQRDAMALNGMLLTIFMGTMVHVLKSKLSGKEIDYSPNVLLAEGIDRSGVLGFISDASNIIDRASRGKIGVSPMLGAPGAGRFKPFDMWSMIGGPTTGTMADLSRIIGSTAEQDYSPGDISAMRRMFPYHNLFYVRYLFDQFEDGLKESVKE